MEKTLKDKLEQLFQNDKKNVVAAQQKQDQADQERRKFLADFMDARDNIIKPAMQELADYIGSKGWTCDIRSQDERTNDRGGTLDAKISLCFSRGSKASSYSGHEGPHFTASCDKTGKKVQFLSSTIMPGYGGSGGGRGSAPLSSITKEYIQEEIAKYITELIKNVTPYSER